MKQHPGQTFRAGGGDQKLLCEIERRYRKLRSVGVCTMDGLLIARRGSSGASPERLVADVAVSFAQSQRSCQALSTMPPDVVAMMSDYGYLLVRKLNNGRLLYVVSDTPDGDLFSIVSTLDAAALLS